MADSCCLALLLPSSQLSSLHIFPRSLRHPAMSSPVFLFLFVLLSLLTALAADDSCAQDDNDRDKSTALKLKIIAIVSILVAGFVGACIPVIGRLVSSLRPDGPLFFVVKAFAAGVILSTGFVHILSDAFENLSSSCLNEKPWQKFPFAGFGAMIAAVATLMVDCFVTDYFQRRLQYGHKEEDDEAQAANSDSGGEGGLPIHTHATHGHAHGESLVFGRGDGSHDLLRHRVIAQVLELGVVVHSIIIGLSLGASESPSSIRPLVVALSFHQFFEGMGLGGCLVQAKFKKVKVSIMTLLFALTTPIGIVIGIGIASIYNENSPTALIVEGLLNSFAAGILIYMALVDLLAADFLNTKVQNNTKLQYGVNVSLLLGIGLMSLLAKWA